MACSVTPVDVPQSDADALGALYDATNGASWTTSTGWCSDTTVGNWHGVTVAGGRVTLVDLNGNNLVGSIPTEIGNLTGLTELYLYGNSLSGSIPAEIGNLTSLTRIFLYNNSLSGSIPAEIGNLTGLTQLRLYNNLLSGSIPTEIGNLTSLTVLHLYNNSLSGSIPTEIGNLTSLTVLHLALNSLSGSILAEIGNLTGLTELYLYNNLLSGSIPAVIGNLTGLINLYLNNNSLRASAAGALQLPAATTIRLEGNQLSQSDVDGILWDIYQTTRTASNGTINVGGSNSSPSGVLQAAASCPVSASTPGREVAHELLNDGCGAGINTWATVTLSSEAWLEPKIKNRSFSYGDRRFAKKWGRW